MNTRRSWMPLCLLLVASAGCETSVFKQTNVTAPAPPWMRSELYFGMNRIDGSLVSDEQWTAFVDRHITPRFPAGLTVHATAGQYRDRTGVIQRERSRVLVVLYPTDAAGKADADLKAIVKVYVKEFDQESVLRTDSPADVSFLGK